MTSCRWGGLLSKDRASGWRRKTCQSDGGSRCESERLSSLEGLACLCLEGDGGKGCGHRKMLPPALCGGTKGVWPGRPFVQLSECHVGWAELASLVRWWACDRRHVPRRHVPRTCTQSCLGTSRAMDQNHSDERGCRRAALCSAC